MSDIEWRGLIEALRDIARQKSTSEIEDLDDADIEYAYDECIRIARLALSLNARLVSSAMKEPGP